MRYHRPQTSGAAGVPLWHDTPGMTQRHSMPLTLVIRIALRALARNLLRSGLSMLGISIGVGAFICSVAVGQGAAQQIEEQIRSLGENFIWIEAGNRNVNGVRTGTHGTQSLTLRDMDAIQQQIPLLAQVSPNVDLRVQVIFRDQNWATPVRGVTPAYVAVRGWRLARGTFFTADDVAAIRRVCVLGQTVVTMLFGAADPVGQTIRVNQLPCQVLGVLAVKGQSPIGQDQDDVVLMPYTVVQKQLKGITWLDDILCSAVSQDAVKMAGQEATAVLRDRHHLRPEEEDDFNIRNPEDIIQAQLDASKTLTVLLIAIASVSLVVGGIGIMNVMLVSVTERTREIGVRVAVGATEEAIQLQFLGEAIMLSLVGGAAGVLFGIFGSYLVGQTLHWQTEMSLESVAVAAVFAIAVGVFFGYYPARKASLLDPIEALRYE